MATKGKSQKSHPRQNLEDEEGVSRQQQENRAHGSRKSPTIHLFLCQQWEVREKAEGKEWVGEEGITQSPKKRPWQNLGVEKEEVKQ